MLTYLKKRHLNIKLNTEGDLAHRSMAKVLRLTQHLYDEYFEKRQEAALPPFHLPLVANRADEGFKAWSHKGEIYLEANSPTNAVYGLSTLMKAVQTPYLPEYLNEARPYYPLRPVWLCSESFYAFSTEGEISLPFYLQSQAGIRLEEHFPFKMLCRYLLENGFNAVILGDHKGNGWHVPSAQVHLASLCQAFQLFGLKVILKPSFRCIDSAYKAPFKRCPFDSQYRDSLLQLLKGFHQIPYDGLLWESTYPHPEFSAHRAAEEATFVEIMAEELKLIEKNLPSDRFCIYYLSSSHSKTAEQYAQWFTTLSHRAGPRTFLAFPAVAGPLEADHLSPHPIWETLRRLPYEITTPLLPILNIGALQQGEGLWPSLSFDLIEQTLSRCYRHHFIGFISLVSRIPTSQGLLACQLWVAGQVLWRPMISPWLFADIWFHAVRPDIPYEKLKTWLKQVREVVKDLSALRQLENKAESFSVDECRVKGEALLSQLLELSLQTQKHPSSLSHYYKYFYRDARRMILKTLQNHQLPVSSFLIGQDVYPSFWTRADINENQNLKNHLNIHYHLKPFYDEKDPIMSHIYLENSLLLDN